MMCGIKKKKMTRGWIYPATKKMSNAFGKIAKKKKY